MLYTIFFAFCSISHHDPLHHIYQGDGWIWLTHRIRQMMYLNFLKVQFQYLLLLQQNLSCGHLREGS